MSLGQMTLPDQVQYRCTCLRRRGSRRESDGWRLQQLAAEVLTAVALATTAETLAWSQQEQQQDSCIQLRDLDSDSCGAWWLCPA